MIWDSDMIEHISLYGNCSCTLVLTQCIGEPLRLVIVYYGYTQCVEANQTQHSPVEALGLDQTTDSEANSLLFSAKVRRAFIFALHAGTGKRRPWGGSWNKTYKVAIKLPSLKLRWSYQSKTKLEYFFEVGTHQGKPLYIL